MATLATSVRQPFGVLDDTKIRHLQSLKNRQNGMFRDEVDLFPDR